MKRVCARSFEIHAVQTIDEGIELLTGIVERPRSLPLREFFARMFLFFVAAAVHAFFDLVGGVE